MLAHVGGDVSGLGVARRVGLQQSASRKALERFVECGLVTRTDFGHMAADASDERGGGRERLGRGALLEGLQQIGDRAEQRYEQGG